MRTGRIRDRGTFAELARSGRRVRRGALTLVLLDEPGATACRVGYAIARNVGPAVTRNRVRRRLRELVRARAAMLPSGALLIRVAPAAATQSFLALGRSLDEALAALTPSGTSAPPTHPSAGAPA